MRYLKQTKQFWKLGMRLFGGKFIRFMSGYKNTTDVLYGESPPGYFDPSNSDINFAVPSIDVLREYTHYNDCSGKRLPGIFIDVMQKVSLSMKDQRDVDLLGFEDGLTLQQRKDDLCQLVSALETNINILKRFEDEASMKCIPVDIKSDVIKELRVFLEVLSTTADIIRKIKVKKEYAKSKFIDRGGSEWRSETLAIDQQMNCNLLPDNKDTNDDTRKIKQRSEEWFSIRKQAKVTGSTLYKAIGLENLSSMRDHFDNVICNLKEAPKNQFTIAAMQHGTDNEINAMSTLVGKILPSLFPDMEFYEEGCVKLFDGWTQNVTTVFEVNRNDVVFFKALAVAEKLYGTIKPKRPTRLPEELPNLRTDIGEFQSTVVIDQNNLTQSIQCDTNSTVTETNPKSLNILHKRILDIVKESYELRREKASEAVVFLLFDLNRNWSKNQLKWAPICWFPKGYSLTSKVMRSIAERVLDECKEQGLHVPSIAFDGQWHTIAFRSVADEPLTRLQLHRDVWKSSEKTPKADIIKEFSGLNKSPTWKKENVIVATNSKERLPSTSSGFDSEKLVVKKTSKPNAEEGSAETVSLEEVIPESVLSTDPFNESSDEEDSRPGS
ncbi:Hypothetical predicted protein [Mytilus galloprovincialis]|uniref:Uncharacterized protein n=1 Tax=Mytilus galloprovincialis TaxID=29158 RepID=A0A8B6F897_MYTGA|nr:Hypothetical predicted protein [Mytilus galloprovincialis]